MTIIHKSKEPEPYTQLAQNSIDKAIKTLANLGCQLAVIDRHGKRYGDLTVVTPKARNGGRHNHNFAQLGYVDKVRALQPGQSELFSAPDPAATERYRAAICGCASKTFGAGSCTSHVEGDIIELLRLV